MRFTLLNLFLAVTIVGIAIAGMIYRNPWCVDGMVTVTVLVFVATAIRSLGLKGHDRAFAIAFSMVGVAYLLVATTDATRWLREALPGKYLIAAGWKVLVNPQTWSGPNNPLYPTPITDIAEHSGEIAREGQGGFNFVGHCVLSLAFALCAGWFAIATYSRVPKTNSQRVDQH